MRLCLRFSILAAMFALIVACAPNAILTGLQDKVNEAQANNRQSVATPQLSLPAGEYSFDQLITITDATAGAVMHATIATGGVTPPDPTSDAPAYSAPIAVSGNGTTMTIKAIATASGMNGSSVVSATYIINYSQVSTPWFSPSTGTYSSDQVITILETTPGATLHYTSAVNGQPADPTSASPTYDIDTPIAVSDDGTTMVIKTVATKAGMNDSSVVSATFTIKNDQVSTPQLNPATGAYSSMQTVTISDATGGAFVNYTTDGSTPTATGTISAGTVVTVSTTQKLSAIAFKPASGLSNSTVISASYTFPDAAPSFGPVSGLYTSAQYVAISTTIPGASIRYTTDGSTPTSTYGTVYSSPVNVVASETLNAIAYESGWASSIVAIAAYTITGTVATPTFSPVAGTYTSGQSVTISTTSPGTTMRYTTDGSTPTSSYGTVYVSAINVAASEPLQAIAYKATWADSVVASGSYTLQSTTPTFSPGAGTYTSAQSVTISTTTPGATMRYTTDGSTPTSSHGTLYSSAVNVAASEPLQAIAYKASWVDSPTSAAAYVITGTVATPTISPAAGFYTSVQSVIVSTTTPGASIRYTTDGSTPTSSYGTVYSVPVSVGVSETVKAIAYKATWADSGVAAAAYTINTATYSVTYNANTGSGTVPTDAGAYHQTDTVTVMGNTGGLHKGPHTFKHWNTLANGNGTSFAGGDTFAMGAANVILYAIYQ